GPDNGLRDEKPREESQIKGLYVDEFLRQLLTQLDPRLEPSHHHVFARESQGRPPGVYADDPKRWPQGRHRDGNTSDTNAHVEERRVGRFQALRQPLEARRNRPFQQEWKGCGGLARALKDLGFRMRPPGARWTEKKLRILEQRHADLGEYWFQFR